MLHSRLSSKPICLKQTVNIHYFSPSLGAVRLLWYWSWSLISLWSSEGITRAGGLAFKDSTLVWWVSWCGLVVGSLRTCSYGPLLGPLECHRSNGGCKQGKRMRWKWISYMIQPLNLQTVALLSSLWEEAILGWNSGV